MKFINNTYRTNFTFGCDPFECPNGLIYNIDYAILGREDMNYGKCPRKFAGFACNSDLAGRLSPALGK